MAETLNGRAVRELAGISAETGVFIAAGILENAGNVLFNTLVLAGEGRLYAHWRKMHIPMFEMQVYNGGGVPEVVDTPLGRIGSNICFDALLPSRLACLRSRSAKLLYSRSRQTRRPGAPKHGHLGQGRYFRLDVRKTDSSVSLATIRPRLARRA